MSSRLLALVTIGALVMSIPLAATTHAQSFLDALFGGGAPQKSYQPRQSLPPSPFSYRAPPYDPHRRRDRDDDDRRDRGGRYKTVCVRLCDGYYFPISSSARRRDFYHDSEMCRSSCGEEGALFHVGASAPDTSEMVDQTGKPYSALPNAFKYRKTLVEGCKCKPEPWAQSEMDRHARYAADAAAADQVRLARLEAHNPQTRIAGTAAQAGNPSRPQPAVVAGSYAEPVKAISPPPAAIEPVVQGPSDPAVRLGLPAQRMAAETPPADSDTNPVKVEERPKTMPVEPANPAAVTMEQRAEPPRKARREQRRETAEHREPKRPAGVRQAASYGGSGFLGLGGPKSGARWPGD